LSVAEPHTSGPELFPQDTILFVEIVDDIALLLVHPTGERDENKPQRVWQRGHGVKATRGWFVDCLRLQDLKSIRLSKRHLVMASIGFLDNTGSLLRLIDDEKLESISPA